MSILFAILSLLSNHDSNSNVKNNKFYSDQTTSGEKLTNDTLIEKKEASRDEETRVLKTRYVKTNIAIWNYTSIKNPPQRRKTPIFKRYYITNRRFYNETLTIIKSQLFWRKTSLSITKLSPNQKKIQAFSVNQDSHAEEELMNF